MAQYDVKKAEELERQYDSALQTRPLGTVMMRLTFLLSLAFAVYHYITAGYTWVVDTDLAKFFDRVNHDKLMAKVAARVADKRVLRLIRGYLSAGVLDSTSRS